MTAFQFIAVDSAGREQRGVLEGDTARHVRQLLRDQGLLPVDVLEVAREESARNRSRFTLRRGLRARDLALVTRQLATLVRSALPLEESLLAVSEQTEQPRIRAILLGVRAKVMEGHTLADSLGEFPDAFPELYRATVAAGEQSGRLDMVLERLADYTENREQLRGKTLAALMYPIILFIVSSLIVLLQLVYVVPKIVKQFEHAKANLPLLTKTLIAFSNFMREWGLWLVIALIAALFAFIRWLQDPQARRRFHRWLLTAPLFGKIVRGSNAARFARTFATLTASSVPVLDALRISGEVVGNLPMRDAVEAAAARVREGAPIAKSLAASRLYPPMLIHLIGSGEASGELEEMLDRAATNQEREMEALLSTLVGLLGPLMILAMGGLVLIIVLAMLLPIFELNQLIGR